MRIVRLPILFAESWTAMSGAELGAQAVRDIIEGNLYLVLASADVEGRPWASPLYFAHIENTEFFWVSSPDATHSQNVAARPLRSA